MMLTSTAAWILIILVGHNPATVMGTSHIPHCLLDFPAVNKLVLVLVLVLLFVFNLFLSIVLNLLFVFCCVVFVLLVLRIVTTITLFAPFFDILDLFGLCESIFPGPRLILHLSIVRISAFQSLTCPSTSISRCKSSVISSCIALALDKFFRRIL
jgi:hypothetical protein